MLKGSLKRLRYGNGKEWVWRRYAMFCFRLREGLGQPEMHSFCVLASQLRFATQAASAICHLATNHRHSIACLIFIFRLPLHCLKAA